MWGTWSRDRGPHMQQLTVHFHSTCLSDVSTNSACRQSAAAALWRWSRGAWNVLCTERCWEWERSWFAGSEGHNVRHGWNWKITPQLANPSFLKYTWSELFQLIHIVAFIAVFAPLFLPLLLFLFGPALCNSLFSLCSPSFFSFFTLYICYMFGMWLTVCKSLLWKILIEWNHHFHSSFQHSNTKLHN